MWAVLIQADPKNRIWGVRSRVHEVSSMVPDPALGVAQRTLWAIATPTWRRPQLTTCCAQTDPARRARRMQDLQKSRPCAGGENAHTMARRALAPYSTRDQNFTFYTGCYQHITQTNTTGYGASVSVAFSSDLLESSCL